MSKFDKDKYLDIICYDDDRNAIDSIICNDILLSKYKFFYLFVCDYLNINQFKMAKKKFVQNLKSKFMHLKI